MFKIEKKLTTKKPPKPKRLNPYEKIVRAVSGQENWIKEKEFCQSSIDMLQGEINTRVEDLIEAQPSLTVNDIMAKVNQLRKPKMPELPKKTEDK